LSNIVGLGSEATGEDPGSTPSYRLWWLGQQRFA